MDRLEWNRETNSVGASLDLDDGWKYRIGDEVRIGGYNLMHISITGAITLVSGSLFKIVKQVNKECVDSKKYYYIRSTSGRQETLIEKDTLELGSELYRPLADMLESLALDRKVRMDIGAYDKWKYLNKENKNKKENEDMLFAGEETDCCKEECVCDSKFVQGFRVRSFNDSGINRSSIWTLVDIEQQSVRGEIIKEYEDSVQKVIDADEFYIKLNKLVDKKRDITGQLNVLIEKQFGKDYHQRMLGFNYNFTARDWKEYISEDSLKHIAELLVTANSGLQNIYDETEQRWLQLSICSSEDSVFRLLNQFGLANGKIE